MRYQSILTFLLVLLWGTCAFGSVSEIEPNSTVTGTESLTIEINPTTFEEYTVELGDNTDPSLATPLPLTDEIVGQLAGTRDYDWYSLTVDDPEQQVTPVYFGCNYRLGFYAEGFPAGGTDSIDQDTVNWQVEYYFDDPAAGLTLQSSYVVYQPDCKQGDSVTKGPFRFQMNTSRVGNYYIRVWGHYVGRRTEEISTDSPTGPPDENGNPTVITLTTTRFIDEILAQTADYSMRVYTTRTPGELEPNDGIVEAYPLVAGTAVSSQLSSMYDEDWFYFDNTTANNITKLPFYFTCKGAPETIYLLSTYNQNGVRQSGYELKGSQCSGTGGFTFTIDAPVVSRYYVSVKSPTYSDIGAFTQSDYSVLVAPNTQSGPPGQTRKDGELEPNENPVDAFPLPANVGITGQLSKTSDFDWYSFDNDTSQNITGVTTITFKCSQGAETSSFLISAYSPAQVVQNNYTISSASCSADAGFKFNMNTHESARYFISIAAGDQTSTTTLNQGDYTLTWSFVSNTGGNGNTGGGTSEGGVEPNSTVVSSVIGDDKRTHEVDITGKINDLANLDPSLATPLPLTDAIIGQLSGTRDYDWYYIDVGASHPLVTPVYFGCDYKDGIYLEGPDPQETVAPEDVSWQVNYYYDSDPTDDKIPALQTSYVVYPDICKRGKAETKGPFRFQMDTNKPGRYYVRIWGRYYGAIETKIDNITYYIDKVAAQTADYNIRVYTTHVEGELEPNDGMAEAYPLAAGKATASQLASMYDQDWFYFDTTTAGGVDKLPFTFTCPNVPDNTVYILSTYNVNGVRQSNYELTGDRCTGTGGFTFTLDTPVMSKYFVSVTSPTYTENDVFTQSDYTLQVNPNVQSGTPGRTRKDGELEPNENTVDAFPLPAKVGIAGQLFSSADVDWYSFDYVAGTNTTGVTLITFNCVGGAAESRFLLSAFNADNKLQNDYTVDSAQCSAASGYTFSMNTPTTATYFLRVSAADGTDSTTLNQNDYTLTWSAVTVQSSTGGGTGARQEGELEPNDRAADAFPLNSETAVISQLATIDDVDYFYVDNDASLNTLGLIPIYFKCNVAADSNAAFLLSAFNTAGVLQNSYSVSAALCAVEGGFRFELNTPGTGRYYVAVAGPGSDQSERFSDADFALSLFAQIAQDVVTATTSIDGKLKTLTIYNREKSDKDEFDIRMSECDGGQKRGALHIKGKKLNLGKLDKELQVKVQIGSWSCTSKPQSTIIDDSNPSRRLYQYPEPIAPPQKTPEPKAYGTN